LGIFRAGSPPAIKIGIICQTALLKNVRCPFERLQLAGAWGLRLIPFWGFAPGPFFPFEADEAPSLPTSMTHELVKRLLQTGIVGNRAPEPGERFASGSPYMLPLGSIFFGLVHFL